MTLNKWSRPIIPKLKIPFYLNSKKRVTLNIYSNKIKVNSIEIDGIKGFNQALYNVCFSNEGLLKFKNKNKEKYLKKSKNGVTYLPKGKYEIELNGVSKFFDIK